MVVNVLFVERVIGDEVWHYEDKGHIARLIDIVPRCRLCHLIKHLGFAGILVKEGKIDPVTLAWHFVHVNGCDLKVFKRHKDAAVTLWKKRPKHRWMNFAV